MQGNFNTLIFDSHDKIWVDTEKNWQRQEKNCEMSEKLRFWKKNWKCIEIITTVDVHDDGLLIACRQEKRWFFIQYFGHNHLVAPCFFCILRDSYQKITLDCFTTREDARREEECLKTLSDMCSHDGKLIFLIRLFWVIWSTKFTFEAIRACLSHV